MIANMAKQEVSVTRALSSFVSQANTNKLTTELRTKVQEVLIDYCGVVSKQYLLKICRH